MFSQSNLKTMHPLQIFSSKSPSRSSPSSTLSSMKLKNLIHTLIVSHSCRIIRALTKVKDVIVEILKDNNSTIHFPYLSQRKHYNKRKKIILGSFRLHYNWGSSKSSHVLPVPQRVYEGLSTTSSTTHLYNDSIEQLQDEDCQDSELAGYLRWLEEKKVEEGKGTTKEQEMNEIDMLAEMFIANCHEKFRLEKQESDRRFQEMLARSIKFKKSLGCFIFMFLLICMFISHLFMSYAFPTFKFRLLISVEKPFYPSGVMRAFIFGRDINLPFLSIIRKI